MPRDRSLDEFVRRDDDATEDAASDRAAKDDPATDDPDPEPTDVGGTTAGEPAAAEATDAEPAVGGTDASAVEPATSTYAWRGAGAACEDCGATVERRWRAEGGLVCADCKEW